MKRPVLIATIGFIIGIIWGLYLNIVLFILGIICLFFIYTIAKNRFIKILKVFINKKVFIIFILMFLIGNIYIKYLEKDYSNIYKLNNVNCIGTVISQRQEKEYTNLYIVCIENINNKKVKKRNVYISINKKNKNELKYGEKIIFEGEYIKPDIQRNYKGFDYSKYLKSKGIYGTVKVNEDIKVLKQNNLDFISIISYKLRNKIISNSNKLFPKETQGIFLGILLGYDELITDEVKQNFSDSNLSHLLAVSGTHVSFVVLGIAMLFKLIKIPKKASKIVTCIILLFYLYIINFTPSVTRAVIMCIIASMQMVLNRKQDIATTISISSLLILISNPYKILNIGFLLSYAGTIGIIIFIQKFENIKTEKTKLKLMKMLKSICFVTISAQILIFPITMYYFNTISLTFIISNLIAGLIIGPITIIGLIIIILSFISIKFSSIIVKFYNFLLLILLRSTEIIARIPISKIYVKTPSIVSILVYYSIVIIIFLIIIIKKSNRYYLNNKLNELITRLKKFIKNKIVMLFIISIVIVSIFFILDKIPKELKLNFIDVGQGDCCMVTTPYNKKIIIDSGGSETYDIGKNTLVPYLLDRGVTKIDYIIISHFDTDHCKGFEYVMENLKIKNAIISKQPEESENYREFLNIAKRRKINVIVVNKGDSLKIEKDLYLNVLWPESKNFISENSLNNNSIVCKLIYKNFSVLFTGDIEEIAEEKILNEYENSNALKSTILKVAHHGSKSSSTQEMLDKIKPKIALIGVGENNKFGHPNNDVLEILKKLRY